MLSKLLTGPQSQITLREVLQRTARIQHAEKEHKREQSTFGLVFTHFFLSISGMSLLSAFSTMTYLPQHKYNGNSHHHPNAFSRPTNYVFFFGPHARHIKIKNIPFSFAIHIPVFYLDTSL